MLQGRVISRYSREDFKMQTVSSPALRRHATRKKVLQCTEAVQMMPCHQQSWTSWRMTRHALGPLDGMLHGFASPQLPCLIYVHCFMFSVD